MSIGIYTIGYGGRSIDNLVGVVRARGVSVIVDVRSYRSSTHWPDFDASRLSGLLRERGMAYMYKPELGGFQDLEIPDNQVRFATGLERLRALVDRGVQVCLLCSERDPRACHRSKTIGPGLVEMGISVTHIDHDDGPRSQAEVESNAAAGQLTLFRAPAPVTAMAPAVSPSAGVRDDTILRLVATALADGQWWTLQELVDRTGASEGTVGARARDLRKQQYGGYDIERRKGPERGVKLYRVAPRDLARLQTGDLRPRAPKRGDGFVPRA